MYYVMDHLFKNLEIQILNGSVVQIKMLLIFNSVLVRFLK